MAGYNAERLHSSRQSECLVPDGLGDQGPGANDCNLGPTPSDMMAAAGPAMFNQPWRVPPEPQWRQPGVPHLVSDNTGPELQLSRIVSLEIIPRLMLLHAGSTAAAAAPARPEVVITAAHVETLTHLAVDGDAGRAEQFVVALMATGVPLPQIFLHLLSPAAKLMGLLWEDDVYSFPQVTIGLWRLQQVLHEQSRRIQPTDPDGRGQRLLLAHVPGAQHTFGAAMVGEFFARDGWHVHYEPQSAWADLHAEVSCGWYDVLGLSIATDDSVAAAASAILELRRASQNKQLFVMVGGPAAFMVADLSQRCGADAVACDAASALAMANGNVRAACGAR